MKDPSEQTKVVVRHLPPGLTQAGLMEHIDGSFAGRYKWMCFRPGKGSQENQRCARAYIDFNRPEDVLEFAKFFNGHVFVNEKGTQFKASVEYAPSQRVPKIWAKKDGREGTIFKDPEYMEFLQNLAKPVENLPSAEIQLEKKEAERAGGAKDTPIVTSLMDFVRQKRAAKNLSQRSLINGKINRKNLGVTRGSSTSTQSKHGSEKQKVPSPSYVLRGSAKNASKKDKSSFILVTRRGEQQPSDKTVAPASSSGIKAMEDETGSRANGSISGISSASESAKQRVILMKGKERELSPKPITSSASSSPSSSTVKHMPRHDASERIIRSILSKEARQTEQNIQICHSEKEKRPPRPPIMRLISKDGISDGDKRSIDAGNNMHHPVSNEKQDKRTRNKDRPDRGVWAPRRPDGAHPSNDSLSSFSMNAQISSISLEGNNVSQHGISKIGDDDLGAQNAHPARGYSSVLHSLPSNHGEIKGDVVAVSRSGEVRIVGSFSGAENGSHRHGGRRAPSHGPKEIDGSMNLPEGKHPKRAIVGHSFHEKQVWVQKTGSG